MLKAVAACTVLALVLTLVPAASAQQPLDGSIYQVPPTSPPGTGNIYFIFSVSGQSFIVGILTFGAGGNGRWFGAQGTLAADGLSGTGNIIFPSGGALTFPANSTFHFELTSPSGTTGTFTTTGLGGFLPVTSGNFARVF